MWEISIKILRGRQLAKYKYKNCVVPRTGEFIYIDNIVYKVASVMYDYDIRFISIMVEETCMK
jgi:hypothetical protein